MLFFRRLATKNGFPVLRLVVLVIVVLSALLYPFIPFLHSDLFLFFLIVLWLFLNKQFGSVGRLSVILAVGLMAINVLVILVGFPYGKDPVSSVTTVAEKIIEIAFLLLIMGALGSYLEGREC